MSDTPKMPPEPKSYWTNDTYPVDLVSRQDYETLAFYARCLQRELADATTRIKDLQDGIAAANERWIADKERLDWLVFREAIDAARKP